jgi:hypothetical protein
VAESKKSTGLGDVLPDGLKPSSRPRIDANLVDNPIDVWPGQPSLEKAFLKLDHTVFRDGVGDFSMKELARVRNARVTDCFL